MDWEENEAQPLAALSQDDRRGGFRMTRRKFLQMLGGTALGAAAMGAGGLTYVTRIEPNWLDLVTLDLVLPRLDAAFAGFRVAQITDIHISHAITGEDVYEACQMVLKMKPDLVVFTGDYVDEKNRLAPLLGELTEALKPLVSQVQSVGVLGNHDYRMSALTIRQGLEGLGIQELRNDFITLTRGKAQLHIAGVDDFWWSRARLKNILERLPEAGAAVLLAHEPDFADRSAKTGRFDLQLSGHSHGGQVVLPVVGPPLLPYLGKKYPAGLYQVGSMRQYTSRGLGMTEPYVRFNCRPEVTIFTLMPPENG